MFVRDAIVSTLVLVGLYGLARGIPFQPVHIPGYLLIVGFDALEGLFGSAGSAYPLLFAVYILGLGVSGAAIATVLRTRSPETPLSRWRVGMAGALGVVGTISILYGVVILVTTSQLVPVLITGVVGGILLALAGWLAGLISTPSRGSEIRSSPDRQTVDSSRILHDARPVFGTLPDIGWGGASGPRGFDSLDVGSVDRPLATRRRSGRRDAGA